MTDNEQPGAVFWGWIEAVILHITVLLVALMLQWKLTLIGGGSLLFPWNWVLVGGVIAAGTVLGAVFRHCPGFRWLGGAKFAIVSIASLCVLAVLGTVILQQPDETKGIALLGFRRMFTSLPFLAMALLMLLNLSTVIGRRLATPRPGNLGFLLNHAGLALTIAGMIAGGAHFVTAVVQLSPGVPASQAIDDQNHEHALGVTLTLKRFVVDWFPPELRVATYSGSDGHDHMKSTAHPAVSQGLSFDIDGVQGRILQFMPHANIDHNTFAFVKAPTVTGMTAAKIEYRDAGNKPQQQWIASGSALNAPMFVMLANNRVLYMTNPVPRAFRSEVALKTASGTTDTSLAVNEPLRVNGWDLYQSSYQTNEMTGEVDSILQAVYDPVLPLVYAGFIAMLLGSFVTFWSPRRRPEPVQDETAQPTEVLP